MKFRQDSNHHKRVLQAAKLAYANKMIESITSQKPDLHGFWQIANNVLNKAKSAISALFNGTEVSGSTFDKAILFAESFSKNSNLDYSGMSLPTFPSRVNLKLHNILVTPKLVKNIITYLGSLKATGPYCIPVVFLKSCEPELS